MKVTPENYDSLKAFFGWMVEHTFPKVKELPFDAQPLNFLSALEQKKPGLARQSLSMGIGDTLEETQNWSLKRTQAVDAALSDAGLPTLSAVRLEFSKKIASIMQRDKVRSELEYYALRNVVEAMPDADRDKAWQLLAAFEEKVGSK
ncbi:MAG: hypothetical protein WA793_08020 [Sphingorhabdus sp.]|uniref:hypothetical protein n=1 Tax=Sphingorhabdus sp. TaxID=1902408 RepID=UPI003C9A12B9